MRFARLAAPAFGPFQGLEILLPAGESDCHLIYGPNEAGKSSLLRAIRDLLYGIPARTPDNFLHDNRRLRIAGTLQSRAGRTLEFQRRKGNRGTLLDRDGRELPDDALAAFLGMVDRDFFTGMFGLGARELREGAQGLLQGRGQLGQALFSASLSGTPVHRILDTLEQDAGTLFQGKATTQVTIRPGVAEYKARLTESQKAMTSPETWRKTLEELERARREREDIEGRLRERSQRRDWVQRCLDALPTIGALHESEAGLAGLSGLPDLDAGFAGLAQQALQRRDQAWTLHEACLGRVKILEARVRESQPRGEILARDAEIDALHGRLALHRRNGQEQAKTETQLAERETDLRREMRALEVSGEPEAVEALRLTASQEMAVAEEAESLDRAEAALRINAQEIERVQGDLDRAGQALAGLTAMDASAMRTALTDSEAGSVAAQGISRKEADLQTAFRRLKDQYTLLTGAPADLRATFELPIPTDAELRGFEVGRAQLDRDREDTEDVIREARVRIGELKGQLQRLEGRGELPYLEDLARLRHLRDAGWEQVIAAWKGGAEAGDLDGLPLEEAYPRRVREADRVADRLREDADAVAQAEFLRQQITQWEASGKEAQKRLEALRGREDDWKRRWAAMLAPTGLPSRDPAAMLEWRTQWMEFRARYEAWERTQAELSAARSDMEAAVARLAPLLSEFGERPLAALREEAGRRVRQADQTQGQRDQLTRQISELQVKLSRLKKEQPTLSAQVNLSRQRWQERCRDLGLPPDTGADAGLALLARRKGLVQIFDEWRALGRALKRVGVAVRDYEVQVRELALAMGLKDATPEIQEAALWDKLSEARHDKVRQDQARADLEEEQVKLDRAADALDEARGVLTRCMEQAGTADEAALRLTVEDLRRRDRLREDMAGLRRILLGPARGDSLAAFIERVRAESAGALVAEGKALDQEIAELDARRNITVKAQAAAEQEKRRLERAGGEAAELQQEARLLAARVQQDAARYIRLQMALGFLREQIERFRKRNQEPLLKRAGELFREITQGSFLGLDVTTVGGSPRLVGVREGAQVEVEGMSDGTRDQLYLALRLAAIERHQQSHEPMPLILDDVLVTFDDQRTRAILPILRAVGRKTQVLLFTHHRHLLDMASGALLDDRQHVHELPGS